MKVNYKIPFYTNTADNVHCVQASMKMAYEHFVPEEKLSFDEWDAISAHVPGLWTWMNAGLVWFKKSGFDVVNIEIFDYTRFASEGERYLLEFAGEEVGRAQIKHSDIKQEMEISKEFLREVENLVRIPTLKDIRSFLEKGFIVICGINAQALDGLNGYSGHSVVVSGCTDSTLVIQDPGLPARQNREVSDEAFMRAWAYPDEKAPNLAAVRLVRK